MKSIFCLTSSAFATAQNLRALQKGCTGSGDFKGTGPFCYAATVGFKGLSETLKLKVYPSGDGKTGKMDLSGAGLKPFQCKSVDATKNGQSLIPNAAELSKCIPAGLEFQTAEYCSDTDQIQVFVKDTKLKIPISGTADRVACDAFESELDVPHYSDCTTEYATFVSTFPYDSQLHGERDGNLDRFAIFCTNLKQIQAHNKRALAGDSSYTQALNQFSDWTDQEWSRYVVGGLKYLSAEEDAALDLPLYEAPHEYSDAGATSDFRNKMPAAKNQGQCGSCWTFGAVDVVDFFGGSHSEQELLDCAPGSGCDGGNPREALQYLAGGKTSMLEKAYSYKGRQGRCQYKSGSQGAKVSQVQRVSSNEQALASAAAKQVVSIAITFNEGNDRTFMHYHSGVFDGVCQDSESGGHAIAVVGVQRDHYIVRNSWGSSWGMSGYAYIKRGDNICNLSQLSTVAHASS